MMTYNEFAGYRETIERLRGQLEEKNETILDHVEIQNSLRHQLHDAIKREVMLRDALDGARMVLDDEGIWSTVTICEKALAATDGLDGLVLCHAEPVAWMNPYGGVIQNPYTGLEKEKFNIPLYAPKGMK